MKKSISNVWLLLILLLIGLPIIYNLSPIQERFGWRVAELIARFKYALSPPEKIVFVPKENDIWATPMVSPQLTPTVQPIDITTATPSSLGPDLPSPTLRPIPKSITLDGFRHEYQTWNNCGPATLAMALSYWGWKGDQRLVAAFTKPNSRDKNVMPYELAEYVEEETELEVVYRVGGDIELLKRFVAEEFPIIIEKGFEGRDFNGWMGHYALVTGFNDTSQRFTLQDSYYGPDQVMEYEDLKSYWRASNFTYIVVYPAKPAEEVATILGTHVDEEFNNRSAAQKAADEIYLLTGRDQFFAWFNRGTNLARVQDYAGAALAYDEAFSIYPDIPEEDRPWRLMWYQTGPYWAYYYTGRYRDVINLATKTLDAMSEPVLEETYYWRALAREALGNTKGAVQDLQSSLKVHPGFEPARLELQKLGITP